MKNPIILAVDDRKDNLFILKQLIYRNFPECILFTATSAREGLQIAEESNLDVVLTDVQMPGVDGIQFCRALKSSKSSDAIVLMLTAHKSSSEMIAQGLEVGAIDYISKPIENTEMVARIQTAFRIKKAEKELQAVNRQLEEKVRGRTAEVWAKNEQLEKEIKERRQVEKVLRETNQRMLTALKETGEGIWDYDRLTGITTFDENWEKTLGYEPGEIAFDKEWWQKHIHPESKSEILVPLKSYLKGRSRFYETEYRVKTKDGKWKWIWSRGIGISEKKSGKVTRFFGTQRDITERRQEEQAYTRLVSAIEQVEDIIIVTDTNGLIEYVSPSFERTMGYIKSEVVGKRPSVIKSGLQNAAVYEEMWQQLSAGKVWSGRLVNKSKNGEMVFEEVTITPVRNRMGEITNYIAVERNITLQIELERQLKQAQKMEAIGTLAGGIAHDFNNILFAIMGYNRLALKSINSEERLKKNLEKLGQAANRAKNLVSQILTFSRRQSDQTLRPMQIQTVLKETLSLIRSTIPSTIEIKHRISQDGGLILGDMTQVHQVVINLATNAYHAVRRDGGILTITTESKTVGPNDNSVYHNLKPGKYTELMVSDTGVGMSKKVLERIFEPYFTTKDQGEGTGLGLSIVHGIIKSHGGQINIESELGKGTSVYLWFPEVESQEQTEFEEKALTDEELCGSERILLVDDEKPISDMLKTMLEQLGYTVNAFTSVSALIDTFNHDPSSWDLVITDMTMPKKTGVELAMELLKVRPELPIILCTGYSESVDEEKAKRIGIREMIMKPSSIQHLAYIVKKTLHEDFV